MSHSQLGSFLKDRRAKLDPAAFGFSLTRRRTVGLRREEVAQRANVSATWYTWLEQGRGGAPSSDVLDRISRALMLTNAEREHLFLLGLGRPPDVHFEKAEAVTPRLQRILDALEVSPALVKTATWDIVAWNRAACAVLIDYGTIPPDQRNIVRLMFLDPRLRALQTDGEKAARFVVAAFRAESARAGAGPKVREMVDELSRLSPAFEKLWREHDVRTHGEGTKSLVHPALGPIDLEYSAFAIDGRPELSMVIYNPSTPIDADRIRALLKTQQTKLRQAKA
jgi:transcriptional regulator with XRE-family HTH domain